MELDYISALLRFVVYGATIAAAGSWLLQLTLGQHRQILAPLLRRQSVIGASLLLAVEPLRYLYGQYTMAGGDWALALSADFITFGLETASGQASIARWILALLLLIEYRWSKAVAIVLSISLVVSYLLEGHTSSRDPQWLLGILLGIHLLVVHWWLAVLWPLRRLTTTQSPQDVGAIAHAFGRQAIALVPMLLIAGSILLWLLTNGTIDLSDRYQQLFIIKLMLVSAILALAGFNKLRFTPALQHNAPLALQSFRWALTIEITVGLAIILTTALAIGFGLMA